MEATACVFLPKDHLFQVPPFTALVLLKHGPLSSSCLGNTGKLHGSSHTVEMGLPSLPLGESLREAESHRQSCFRSDGQNRTGFFLSPLIKNNFSLCSFFLLSAKCQECLRLTTTHVKEKQTPRNTGSITPSSAFCLFPSQTLFYALARHHQNSSCPFQLKSLETFVLQNTKGEGEETLSTQRAAFRTKQSHGLSAGLKNEGLGKV